MYRIPYDGSNKKVMWQVMWRHVFTFFAVNVLVLSPMVAVYASDSPANSVHFCLPFDYEQWRRDHPRPAAKRLANLNVGEPRTVRMIYFLPNDRPFQQEVVDSMKVTIRQIQTFYADQMEAHGYGRKTFRFETDAQGEPLVHRMDGQHPDSHYLDNTSVTVFDEIVQAFDVRENVYFVAVDNSINRIGRGSGRTAAGVGGQRGKNGGHGLVSGRFSWTTVAHEFGHAFGLWHDFHDDALIMSYGHDQRGSLSTCHAEFLAVQPYFNPDIPTEEARSPTIELISPNVYPSGSKSIPVQLRINDEDGLHQAILFVVTREPHSAAGSREVKACRGFKGEQVAIAEFDYDGVVPSASGTSLSDFLVHRIIVQAVDSFGNVRQRSFSLFDVWTQRNLIATLEGHTDYVRSVSFSPDGKTLASGSEDRTIRLWDVATRTNIATLEGHTHYVRSVSFSPDGKTLASGSDDHTVRLWDVATRTNIATLEGHTHWITSVSFSPNGKTLASGSWDRTIRLWDVATRTNIATLKGHTSTVRSVSFSPDGKTLASGSEDRTIRLWDVATRTNIATLKRHTDVIASVSFSPDGKTLASGSWDHTIRLWDVATKTNIATLGGPGWVPSVSFSPDGKTLASGSGDRTIPLWDISPYITPSARIPDFNSDGVIDFADFLLFVAQFGFSQGDEGYDAWFDLNGDGTVGFDDFLIFVENFGKEVPNGQ